jgi:hypothetical protein
VAPWSSTAVTPAALNRANDLHERVDHRLQRIDGELGAPEVIEHIEARSFQQHSGELSLAVALGPRTLEGDEIARAQLGEGAGVEQVFLPTFRLEEQRLVRDLRDVGEDGVDLRRSGQPSIEEVVAPRQRADHGQVRVQARELADRLLELVERGRLQRGRADAEGLGQEQWMRVGVDEPGHHHRAPGVDDARVRADEPRGSRRAADEHDASARDGHGLGEGLRRVERVDEGVGDDEVGGQAAGVGGGPGAQHRTQSHESEREGANVRHERSHSATERRLPRSGDQVLLDLDVGGRCVRLSYSASPRPVKIAIALPWPTRRSVAARAAAGAGCRWHSRGRGARPASPDAWFAHRGELPPPRCASAAC